MAPNQPAAEQERMRQQLSGTSLMSREMDLDGDFNSNVEEAYEFVSVR
jgi:hypothetical protein